MITKTCDNCGFTETINDEEATCDGLPKGLGRVFPENWSKIFIQFAVKPRHSWRGCKALHF
jgi:hypothetical protein